MSARSLGMRPLRCAMGALLTLAVTLPHTLGAAISGVARSFRSARSVDATVGARFGIDTCGVGEDTGQPVTPEYKAPFEFNGDIKRMTVDIK